MKFHFTEEHFPFYFKYLSFNTTVSMRRGTEKLAKKHFWPTSITNACILSFIECISIKSFKDTSYKTELFE